ncbi:hypothetical protein CSHISOI_11434 [Colletotrichum shisoi]|uniref:Uncharacterized protein n=1 Tax=Colletotrichum shisoi TaxID=2078593 RepID=A0A5Q4BAS8_9PEZI|nr:hypothetical protein CSHISOI_11434 [Colletotrichum shisoi]
MEGSYKRAYAYIDGNGEWCLVTGLRIGALKTEWVSQVRTSPRVIGFIEGAPPVPADSFISKDKAPTASVKFKHITKCTYTYSSPNETTTGSEVSPSMRVGDEWEVEAGFGVEEKIAEGNIGRSLKTAVDISSGHFNNEVRASTTNVNMETGVQLTSTSSDGDDDSKQPKKEGCLDGRRGVSYDPSYPAMSSAPKDASYYKPTEAYALRERIRRAEEQLQGEYDRLSLVYQGSDKLPQRTHRNICNAYVWTADGGTYQEARSTLDMVKSEVGGSLDNKLSLGASTGAKVHQRKAFELATELPPAVDIRYKDPNTGRYLKTPGAVDAYRWMSFWPEPSVEATDTVSEHVLDHA